MLPCLVPRSSSLFWQGEKGGEGEIDMRRWVGKEGRVKNRIIESSVL